LILKNNRQFLSENLSKLINNANDNNIIFKTSKDNLPVPFIDNAAVHSTYYPLKDGERLQYSADKKTLNIAIGLAGGYHLVNLANKGKKIIAVPIDLGLLKAVLTKIDLSKWFTKDNLNIITPEEIDRYFNFYVYSNYNFIFHHVLKKLYQKKIIKIIKIIGDKLRNPLLEINTQKKFGKIWFENAIRNIIYQYNTGFNFDPLVIKNKPVLITGAGPSLSANIDILKKLRDDIFIAATDTSLKILNKFNINPDIVFTFDAQHYSYFHFCGINNNFRLFSDFTSSLRLFKNQTLLFANHPLRELFKQSGWDIKHLSSNTRNIGGAVIDFFKKYFNDYPIITVGIDYGYHNHYSYAKGSYIDDYRQNNSDYYTTAENYDCNLYYKYKIIKNKDNWITTDLMMQYNNAINNEIYTLSDSPFLKSKKINFNDFKNLIFKSKELKPAALNFKEPGLKKDDFILSFIKGIKNNTALLDSYFLSIGKMPDENEVDKLIMKIKNILH